MKHGAKAVLDLEERQELLFRIIWGVLLAVASFALFMFVGMTIEELLRKGVEIDSKVVERIHFLSATLFILGFARIVWWVTFDPR